MLPVKSSFNRTAMCGHTGNATVFKILFRSITRTILIFSQKKSTIAEAKKQDSLRSKYGSFFIVWSELEIKQFKSTKV